MAEQHLLPCRALDLAVTKLSMMAALSSLWLGSSILVGRHQGRPASAVWPGWREAVQPWLVSPAVPWALVTRPCLLLAGDGVPAGTSMFHPAG